MIVTETTSKPIDKIAISQEKKFKIKASAKAFKLLSSTLYPDPISAPIRELGTNAADSHREAGTKDPFLVHLPNELEPYFYIRDYGTGMSEDKIDKVYCTYFESTRSDSNDFTGAFGLGSKTPFCYSDTFNVTSFYNGKKTLYTAFLEQGEPKMAKFAEEDTTERNGIQVAFPVKPEDIRRFVDTAMRVYSRFKEKPTVIGNADFQLKNTVYSFVGDGWRLKKSEDREVPVAIMGNIGYPLDKYKLGISYGHEVSDIADLGIEIDFEIGELQPTVSREDIQYDQDTCALIRNRLSKIKKELVKIAVAEVEKCSSYYEARVKYHEIMNGEADYDWQLKSLLSSVGFSYDGKSITKATVRCDDIIKDYVEKNKLPVNGYINYSEYLSKIHWCRIKFGLVNEKLQTENIGGFSYSRSIKYFVNDEVSDKDRISKLKYYLRQNKDKVSSIYLFSDMNDAFVKYFVEYCGIPTDRFQKVSSLPLPPKVVKPKGVSTRVVRPRNLKELDYIKFENLNATYPKVSSHPSEVVDLNATGEFYFIDTFNGQYKLNNSIYEGTVCLNTLLEIVKVYFFETGISIDKVYYFNSKRRLNNIPSNWKNITDVVFEKFNKKLENLSEISAAIFTVEQNSFLHSLLRGVYSGPELDGLKDIKSVYSKYKNIIDSTGDLRPVTNNFKLEYKPVPAELGEFKENVKKFEEKYSFFKYVKSYSELSWRETQNVSEKKYNEDIEKMLKILSRESS